jgi:ketosteroid isomerase-like protein
MQAFYAEAVSISKQNVEIVRRTMDAYNTRDLPAYFDMLSESVRFRSRFSAMGRVYRGHDDLRRYFAELDEVWSRYEMRVLRLVPAGRQVAALCHLYAVGRESDLQVEENSAIVFTLEAGKIVRIDAYPTHAEALDAVGLRE